MTTLAEVATQPVSGLNHIDALLARGPGWNWLAPARTTLNYSFALSPNNPADVSELAGAVSAFNAAQQAAVVNALNLITAITGITFAATADGNAADLHFAAADIVKAGTSGRTSWVVSYGLNGDSITNFTADAWIYLDNAELAAVTTNPTVGSAGFQVLLHELGHAMGLKHPFEGSVTLPTSQDNTTNTLLSYTNIGGPYPNYQLYDIAALRWLYGNDGLGGALGWSSEARFYTGTDQADSLTGAGGDDVFEGRAGNDVLAGGIGNDTARFSANLGLYTITAVSGGFQVIGPDGTDSLTGIERAVFADATIVLQSAVNNPPTGGLLVSGTVQQGATLSIVSTLADPDGLGTLSWRWQSSSNAGASWIDLPGATTATLVPAQAQVGQLLRVVGSYVDLLGNPTSVTSAATGRVGNVNDAPVGSVLATGAAQQGGLLLAAQSLADADGLGSITYRWQSSVDATTWRDVPGGNAAFLSLDQSLVGLRLRVLAEYTDGQGTLESVPSPPTAAVLNVNDAPTGTVTISGTVEQGGSLRASQSLADVDGLGSISFEWQSSTTGIGWSPIAGTSGDTFVPGLAQVGQLLRALARWTDGQGTPEFVASSATTPVIGVQNGGGGNDRLDGTPYIDRLTGNAGNDRITGLGGSDVIDGGSGIDTAVFQRSRADYIVGAAGSSVRALAGDEGTDTLSRVERLKFADLSLAFDLDDHAGTVARILGAVFGREAVSNASYAGIGLGLLDGGSSRDSVMKLALDTRLGGNWTVSAEVQLLFRNVAGVEPTKAELDHFVSWVSSGQYTPVSLANYAADLALNAQNIELVGLASSGLAYSG